MRTLLMAQGNCLRCDDGIAHAVLKQLRPTRDMELRDVLQLTPEIAGEMAGFDTVIFLDADILVPDLFLEPLDRPSPPGSRSGTLFTHYLSPAEVMGLARSLFGFAGRAFLFRLPADDLSAGEVLTPRARAVAAKAVVKLEKLLRDLCTGRDDRL